MKNTGTQALKIHLQIAPPFAPKVKQASLHRAVQAAFESAGRERTGELTVVITDDAQVKELNRVYRGVDASTDVLAFGDADEAGAFVPSPDADLYLGDIVISYPRAVEQAAVYGHSTERELSVLVVHGVLHLLGHDHEEVDDRGVMWPVQSAALGRLGIHWQP
jgi:probable rRNA maturation factor